MPAQHSARRTLRWAARMATGLLLAAVAFADDYPAPAGFVNDFAHQLPAAKVQHLEKKVRDYERTTGNEIAVAVVPSLNGMLVDDYARGMFHAWGVGKRALNNGVLFVWAPQERRIRIEVGLGLEGALTDAVAGGIVSRVRDLFRAGRYDAGVNAALDGIIQALGTGHAAGTLVPDERNFVERNSPAELERQRQEAERQRQEQERRQQEEDAARAAKEARQRGWILGCTVVLGVVLYWMYRRRRAARWQQELPGELAGAAGALAEADQRRAQAQAALSDLRKEAPEEIYRQFDATVASAPDELARQRSDLERLRSLPCGTYAELKAAHEGLLQWRQRTAAAVKGFDEVPGTLDTFRAQRKEAQEMLTSLPPRLTRMQAEGVPASAEGLLRAAADTYSQALQKSQEQPANWLLVYDLLADILACLERIENPGLAADYRPQRYWFGDIDSPAADVLVAMFAAQMASSSQGAFADVGSSGGDSGGFGGGGDSGGFGGGDSGGGGASSDY